MEHNTSINEFSKPEENNASLLKRFYIYQKERFPIIGHGMLVASFSFSAISYSLICRGVSGFVSWKIYAVGIFTTISLFMLVRIFDEFKDAQDDAKFRKNLPVPRGLIRLKELMVIGIILAALQIAVNLYFFPKMLLIYVVIMGYLLLMTKEFFIADWLKKHQFWYITSHMFIIPLVDVYASGLDWHLAAAAAPKGLLFFFVVSYMNGIVLEIGRKIRTPEDESEGVLTYTAMLGTNAAPVVWILVLFVTYCLSIAAAYYAGYGTELVVVLGVVFLLCCIPALLFISYKTKKTAKLIEMTAALWTVSMYLSLGGVPMLNQLMFN